MEQSKGVSFYVAENFYLSLNMVGRTNFFCFCLHNLTAHHWSPLSEEVEFVRTKRDVQQASFECAKDRHIFPFVDVNARFGIIKYVESTREKESSSNTSGEAESPKK